MTLPKNNFTFTVNNLTYTIYDGIKYMHLRVDCEHTRTRLYKCLKDRQMHLAYQYYSSIGVEEDLHGATVFALNIVAKQI